MNRLATGSATLVRRYRIWLWSDGVPAGLLRVGGGLAAVGFVGGVCLAAPVLLAPAVGLWLLCAWYVSRPGDSEQGTEEERDDYTSAEFLELLHELMAKDDRLHLAQIAADLYDDPDATGQVRELCAAVGASITRGVRVPGRGVSTGLYRRDLPPLPAASESGPVAVVAAGQGEQQQQQHPGRQGFVVLPDADGNPHRHEVRWINQPTRQAS